VTKRLFMYLKLTYYVEVTTLSGMYCASVTRITDDGQCCNILISWPLTRWR